MKTPISKITTVFALVFCTIFSTNAQTGDLLPSEVLALMYQEVNENPDKGRLENTKRFGERVKTENLDLREQYLLGEVYFWNLQPNEAKAAFSKVLDSNSLYAHAARQRIWIININGFGLFDEVESDLKDYMESVNADPSDRFGSSYGISLLARKYLKDGEHQKLVDLIDKELDRLDFDGAYTSYLLPIRYADSYVNVGKQKEIRKKMKSIRDGLSKTLDQRKDAIPEKDFSHTEYCSTVSNMLTAATEKLGYAQLNEKYENIIKRLDQFLEES